MTPRPWKPADELTAALGRGDLRYARRLAREVSLERGGAPIELATAARFLPLIAAQEPQSYDRWALHWLGRWISETQTATIEQAAEVAGSLADLPAEPAALGHIAALAEAP